VKTEEQMKVYHQIKKAVYDYLVFRGVDQIKAESMASNSADKVIRECDRRLAK